MQPFLGRSSSNERFSCEFLQRVLSLYEKSRAADFGFTPAEFCELLTEVAKRALGEGCSAQERARFVETLRLDDLVLARACARGHEAAWERFLTLYREKLCTAASIIAREESVGRELADSLYAQLFGMRVRGDGARVSKFESYLGRGSLEGWLRTILAQEYVNKLRSERKLITFDEAIGDRLGANSLSGPKLHNSQLAGSIDAALGALSPEERFLLAAYYLDGRTLAEIGRMLNVHESTIKRRMDKTIVHLRKQIMAHLRATGLSKRAAEEMLESDVRDLDIDVRNRLAQEGRT